MEEREKAVLEEAKLGFKGRFGAGLPAISDGSMLFIQNVAAKLAPIEQGGGKAAIVLSGSPCSTATPAPGRRTFAGGCSRRTTSTAS